MKITFSPLVAGASGRAADAVAATWKGRAYIRKYVVPHNPDTVPQGLVRDSFTLSVTLWRSMSSTIKAWLDTYGVGYRMSGFNVFMAKNRAAVQAAVGLKPVPVNPNVSALADVVTNVTVPGALTITWDDPALAGFTNVALLLRKALATGFTKEILTVLAATETITITPLTTADTYRAYIGLYNPTTGVFGTMTETAQVIIT